MRRNLFPLLELSDFSVTFIVWWSQRCVTCVSKAPDFLYLFALPVASTSSITGLGCYKCVLCNWMLRCRSWLGDKRSELIWPRVICAAIPPCTLTTTILVDSIRNSSVVQFYRDYSEHGSRIYPQVFLHSVIQEKE